MVYGTASGQPLNLDIYYSAADLKPAPLVVFTHAGSFTTGDKRLIEASSELPELMARGYVVASVNYRLSVPFPAPIEDAKAAVRFLRGNAAKYGIDPQRIGAWGQSAGGYLACFLALTTEADGFEGTDGTAGVSSRVSAVVDQYGPTDFALSTDPGEVDPSYLGPSPSDALLAKASPVTYVTRDAPPFLVMHGAKDNFVPVAHSQELVKKLTDAGVTAELVVVKNAGHNFKPIGGDISPSEAEIGRMAGEFFDNHLKA